MKKLIIGVLSAILLYLDLYTKTLTETYLKLGESFTVIPGFFDFTYLRNTGGAWSMFDGGLMLPIFLAISLGVSAYALYMFIKEDNYLLLASIALILPGNLGNFYDRIIFSYVRDMLAFNIFGYNFPVFNLADVFLVLGFGLLFIYIILEERKDAKNEENNN